MSCIRCCVPCDRRCHSFVLLDGIQGGSLGSKASAGLRFQPSAIHPSTMLLSMTSCTRKRSRMPSQYYPLSSLRWRLFVDGGSGRGPGVTRRPPHPGAALSLTECPPIDDTGCTDQAVSVARDPAFCTVVHFTNGSSFATFIVLESSNMPLLVQLAYRSIAPEVSLPRLTSSATASLLARAAN